jgi:cytochrome c556
MKAKYIMGTVLVATLSGAVLAADPAPKDGPGWTGLTEPEELIEAREALMVEMERIMRPLDSYTIGEPASPDELRSIAQTVSQMMLAVPHLFPPTTNLYDPNVPIPKTLALPAIWQNWAAFEALAEATHEKAEEITTMRTPDELKAGALALRATCDACHVAYLRPYVPAKVTDEDLNFDFDSVLKNLKR